jgi:phosphoglycolate phosphatase
MRAKFPAVIFDLDGTLLDSLADIANAGNTILQAHGFPVHTTDAYRYFVGDGVRRLMHRIVPPEVADDATFSEQLIGEFVELYHRTWNIESRLYDGVTELLDPLVAHQVRLAVLSNKPQAATEKCVAHYLPDYPFAAVLGQQAGRPPKPDLTGVREILAQLRVSPAGCCYVGDTAVDMQTARGAGLFAAGATWGFRDAAELQAGGADVLIDRPPELLRYLLLTDS